MSRGILHDQLEDFEISRKIRTSDYDMAEAHYHPYYELFYLLSGQCRIFINHTLYHVEAGNMVILSPGTIHRTTYRSSPMNERITINFSERYLAAMAEVCGKEKIDELLLSKKITIPSIRRAYAEDLLQKIEYEDSQKDIYSKLLKQNHLYELLILYGRCQTLEKPMKPIDETEKAILQAAQYIYHHYANAITLEEISAMVHMSPTYFSRRFKKVTGFGYKEYLNNVRIKEAATLLLGSQDSITQIAVRCGFSDGNYFGDVFRKAKGMSPHQYRKNPEIV